MKRRGITLIEVLVIVVATLVLLGLVLPHLGGRCLRRATQVKDATQVKYIHNGWLTAAADRGGAFPLPGDINRRIDPAACCPIPGSGLPDESRNEHASLHSALIAGGFVSPEILCSPAETNPRVGVCCDYDFHSYNPAQDTFWDETHFRVDLNVRSNTSYAAMPLDNTARRAAEWRASNHSQFAVLGNRGVRGGVTSGAEHDRSSTLRFFKPHDAWGGNVCFNDNHVVFASSPEPAEVRALASLDGQTPSRPDNLFRNDTYALPSETALRNSDSFLVVQMRAAPKGGYLGENSPELSWD